MLFIRRFRYRKYPLRMHSLRSLSKKARLRESPNNNTRRRIMDPHLFHRLWRRPWLSLCSLILSTALCFLVCFLTDYRQNQQQELSQMASDWVKEFMKQGK